MTSIPESHRDLLDGEVVLATNGPDGRPQVTAIVARIGDDGVLETSMNMTRQKVKNMLNDPRVTIFKADPQARMRTVEVRADAEVIADPDKVWSRAFAAGLGFDITGFDGPGEDRSRVRFHPVKVNTIG